MTEQTPIAMFFSAWALPDEASRRSVIEHSVAPGFTYCDPRCPAPVTGLEALVAMVGQFTDAAPGWSAWVENEDNHNDFIRARVAFGTEGQAQQHGTYFARIEDGKLTLIAGFKGIEA